MFEVVTGQCIADFVGIAKEAGGWPPREKLPSTRHLWLGPIIEACWTQGRFNTTKDLCQLLEGQEIPDLVDEKRSLGDLLPAIIS
jgi:hypothetical protein